MITNAATVAVQAAVPVVAAVALANPVTACAVTVGVVGLAGWKYGECLYDAGASLGTPLSRFGTMMRRNIHAWTADAPVRAPIALGYSPR